ncbi:hypothetical protein WDU94_011812 [Cyamophila willieti]
MYLTSYVLLTLSFLSTLYCDKILVFLPLPIWSHQMQYERVWTALAERGHEVTIYSAFPSKANLTNLKHVPIRLPKLEARMTMASVAPLVPNIIRVGGIHLKKPEKLPADLQKRADAAKDGFVYMSFGSVVDPSKFNEKTKLKLLGFLKEIKVPVFWKIDLTNDPVIKPEMIPRNVFTQKWYPQTDILAHPNVRLFITHGGLSSLMEATSLGVPVLGVPFFGDQYSNLMLLKSRGYALVEPIQTLSQETMLQQAQLMLKDPGFRDNAKKWSLIFNDELSAPLDRAVYWTEYVLRHKGAPHLSSYSRHLSWYQLYSVDVIITMLALLYAVVKLFTMCCCRAGSKQSVGLTKKKN